MAARAFTLWRETERHWEKKLYRRTGALWMVADEGEYVRVSMPILEANGFPYEKLTKSETQKRYPQIQLDDIRWALLETEAGYLSARRSCADVVEGFVSEGGEYREVSAAAPEIGSPAVRALRLSDGSTLSADLFVFACGPWLPKIFPDVLGDLITATRQDVFFFGTPAGDARFSEDNLPVWFEMPRFMYGIPGNERRGFKIADNDRGAPFDPTDGDRRPSEIALQTARECIARRFPELKNAPVVESRVCQYENSPDNHFLVDRHPAASNVWIVGGGSGHGFKHGPAIGEMVADMVLEKKPREPLFSLSRFNKTRQAGLPSAPRVRMV
jgi:glycine/D-amino acid oxidase-like deaminating enzyme